MLKFLRVSGMALYPFILLHHPKAKNNRVLINHEKIHLRQQLEMLVVFFYPIYLLEFLCRYLQYKNWHQAYLNISFEREAYANEHEINYLKNRSFWAFTKYLSC